MKVKLSYTDLCSIAGTTCDMHIKDILKAELSIRINAIMRAKSALCRKEEE